MLVSYNWLKKYLGDSAPTPEDMASILTRGAFEIEEVRVMESDTVIDVDVLPNRAHDCLCHRGIAREIAVLGNVAFADTTHPSVNSTSECTVDVAIHDAMCRRYVARVIENVTVGESPAWLKERLAALGQRSINTIVDATNYVMYDIGQPLHVFDADKLAGGIAVRAAKEGERMTTLDGKDITLTLDDMVIADDMGALALAGVKGGKKAETDVGTKNIVLESANFHPTRIRKTSGRVGIKTDSSKRFENELSPELAAEAMERVTALICELSPGANAGSVVDMYPRKATTYVSGFAPSRVNDVLGTDMSVDDMSAILDRFGFAYTTVLSPREMMVVRARELMGTPYKLGASILYDAPQIFDCSSLMAYLYAHVGIQIPCMAVDQYAYMELQSREELREGDVVFFNSGEGTIAYETKEYRPGTKVPEGVDHCGMYVGNGNIVHASQKKGMVVEDSLDMFDSHRVVGYGRVRGADEVHVVVQVPSLRLDLRIAEDFIEEIGRVYGYDRVPSREPRALHVPAVLPIYFVSNTVRRVLGENDFSELYTSSFRDKGELEVLYPAASDKNFLRTDIASAMVDRLVFNARNMDLFGIDHIAVYEVGSVFTKENGERVLLALGLIYPRMKEGKGRERAVERVGEMRARIAKVFGVVDVPVLTETLVDHGLVVEINLDALAASLPLPVDYGHVLDTPEHIPVYKIFSPYPFMTRDIAFWTPIGTSEKDARVVVEWEGHPLAIRTDIFDTFEKDGRVSYAFRIVFQAPDRTLTDEEVNRIIDGVYMRVKERGWEAR